MTRLLFVVPASGRVALTEVCLRQLARTCEALAENGVQASAIVAAGDENLDVAKAIGFGTVECGDEPLGMKFNHLFEAAGWELADYIVPSGSDDWIDPALLQPLPADDEVLCFTRAAIVSEDGGRVAPIRITGRGGLGIRVIPRGLLERSWFRPAADDATRLVDASVIRGLGVGVPLVYRDLHDLQIVDWKSDGEQINSYQEYLRHQSGVESRTPFHDLEDVFPADALAEMRSLYVTRRLAVAA